MSFKTSQNSCQILLRMFSKRQWLKVQRERRESFRTGSR